MEKEETELETAGSIKTREKRIFEELPVPKAVMSMVLPTIISQIIFVIYNLADTWYVGLTENANAVAAISLCLPVYTLMTGISNLFGIGGDSVIARALGTGKKEKASQTFAISVWSALLTAVIYACAMFFAGRNILLLIGGDPGDIDYAVSYTFWTIVIGGMPTILTATLAHLVRAAGYSRQASFGMILGAVLNMIFDPLFMFVLLPKGNEVTGAAMATAISNLFAMFYFLGFILKNRASGLYALNPFTDKAVGRTFVEIIRCGLPGFCMIALAMLSNCFLNSMLSTLGNEAVAGVGIVRKIDQLAYAVNQGVTQGMLPLVAYCYASGRQKRMWSTVGFAAACSEGFSVLCTVISLIFAPELMRIFIRDATTIQYGTELLRIICLAVPVYTLTFVIITVFQAMGKGFEPFLLSVLHKGSLDILMMLLIKRHFDAMKIVWATPISEVVALITALALIGITIKKGNRQEKG